jgi:hypothetical protein
MLFSHAAFGCGGPSERCPYAYRVGHRVRSALGEHDLILTAGEAAEFDTRTPHGFANAGDRLVEFLSLFGAQGERTHVRAHPATT